MTGFGRAALPPYTMELRAVNHRYLDLSLRLPRGHNFLEEALKQQLSARLNRGKVELTLIIDHSAADSAQPTLNPGVLEAYLELSDLLVEGYGLSGGLTVHSALGLPDVIRQRRVELDEEQISKDAESLCAGALAELIAAREREGTRLCRDVLDKLDKIESLTKQISARYPEAVEAYRQRLHTKMQEVLEDRMVSQERLLTEAALYADRMCADEETVRIHSHCTALRGLLQENGGAGTGRKLDFWTQELAREANTIGSKSQDAETSRLMIDLKSEIEKVREQVQNVE